MLVKRKIRKILSKSLIPYFLNSLNKDKEILVKRSPGATAPKGYIVNLREKYAASIHIILHFIFNPKKYVIDHYFCVISMS